MVDAGQANMRLQRSGGAGHARAMAIVQFGHAPPLKRGVRRISSEPDV